MDAPLATENLESTESQQLNLDQNFGQSHLSSLPASSPNPSQDSGSIPANWQQELLSRYNADVTKVDAQEEALLDRLAALQKLQLIWAAAGRTTEMDRSNKRLKTRVTKIALEDERLSKKRTKLEEATTALQNVLGMLDDSDSAAENRAGT